MTLHSPLLLPLACDAHVHVFAPARFPYAAQRAYTPPAADVAALEAHLAGLSMARVVLVQPSVYGDDNRCLLDAIARLGQQRARGVAVLTPSRTAEADLARLHEGGVRGLRLNLHVSGEGPEAARQQVREAGALIAGSGWHLQVHADMALIASLLDDFSSLPVPVVLDHFAGGLRDTADSDQHLARVCQALATGRLFVKLSAPYRLWSGAGPDHARRLTQAFANAAPERVLWGSDWPHTGGSGARAGAQGGVEAFREVDNPQVLRALLDALPDDAARHRLLVANPASLYGFDD